MWSRCVTFLSLVVLAAGASSAQPSGGTVDGKVIYTGKAKKNPLIQMGADPNCQMINAGKKVFQEMVDLQADGTIGNVFIYLSGDLPPAGPPAEPLRIVQEGCVYLPRVNGAVAGQELVVVNGDATLHNVHSTATRRNGFNVGQPRKGMEFKHQLRLEDDLMFSIRCDIHPWMVSWVAVLPHRYFDVTGEDGSFRIDGVPPGRYQLHAWQERLGTLTREVVIEAGGAATVELAYDKPGP